MDVKHYKNIGETLYTETLDNGLTVLVSRKPDYSKSYAMFAVSYGGADRRFRLDSRWIDSPAGVAHYLEHKMFDTPDGGNALTLLSSNGASPNAYTSSDVTAYHFESTANFYENLRTLLSFVSVPYFTEESVQKERGIIGQEIRMVEDMPSYTMYYNLLRDLFAQNPVRESVAGTIDSISHITAQTLYDCHKAFYTPANMVLCVAGDVDPHRVVSIARELLPKQSGPAPQSDYGKEDSLLPVKNYSSADMEVSAPQFMLGARIAPAENGSALLRQQLTADIAVACMFGRSSPFYLDMYSDGLLSSDFFADVDYTSGSCIFTAGGESRDPHGVADKIKSVLSDFAETGPDPELFARIKKACFGARLRALDSFDALCSGMMRSHFKGFCPLDAFSLIDEISLGELMSFVRENLVPERIALSVIMPKKQQP